MALHLRQQPGDPSIERVEIYRLRISAVNLFTPPPRLAWKKASDAPFHELVLNVAKALLLLL